VRDKELKELLGSARFFSVTYRLFKLPEAIETLCEDYGQACRYKVRQYCSTVLLWVCVCLAQRATCRRKEGGQAGCVAAWQKNGSTAAQLQSCSTVTQAGQQLGRHRLISTPSFQLHPDPAGHHPGAQAQLLT